MPNKYSIVKRNFSGKAHTCTVILLTNRQVGLNTLSRRTYIGGRKPFTGRSGQREAPFSEEERAMSAALRNEYGEPLLDQHGRPLIDKYGKPLMDQYEAPPAEEYYLDEYGRPLKDIHGNKIKIESEQNDERADKPRDMGYYLGATALLFMGLAYLSAPLYRVFCQVRDCSSGYVPHVG